MEEVPVKRERESEEDANQRQAKALKDSEEVRNMEIVYMLLPREKQEKILRENLHPLGLMPQDWQKVIAKTTPGILMILARTSKMFADIANLESVWKDFFRRDFPKEWNFCKGRLPFFVLDKRHIFYIEGGKSVPRKDENPWKRFYLNTAFQYREFARFFIQWGKKMFKSRGDVPALNLEWAKMRDIYEWIERVPLKMRFTYHDFKAVLAWKFVKLLTVAIIPPRIDLSTNQQIALEYLRYAIRLPTRHWLLPYLAYCNPWGLSSYYYSSEYEDENFNDGNENYGPTVFEIWFQMSNEEREGFHDDDYEIADQWDTWFRNPNRPHFASSDGVTLFSLDDKNRLLSLLNPIVSVDSIPGFEGLSDEEAQEKRYHITRCWEMLQSCFYQPCLYSLPTITLGAAKWESYIEDTAMILPHDLEEPWFDLREAVYGIVTDNHYASYQNNGVSKLSLPSKWWWRWDNWIFPDVAIHLQFIHLCRPFSIFYQRVHGDNYTDALDYHRIIRLITSYRQNPRTKQDAEGRKKIIYLETCIQCGATPTFPQQCGGTCQRAIYCNVDCQMKHWISGHRNECQKKGSFD